MKTFVCQCGARLFFDNTLCLACNRKVGFSSDASQLVALDDSAQAGGPFRPCSNYGRGRCNWVLGPADSNDLCLACRLNVETPESGTDGDELMGSVETAKRRLVFSLLALGLPVVPLSESEDGVGFALRRGTADDPVTTGHADGLITLDLNEADPAKREETRKAMGEDYRTLLGHFRHEVGHYYWTRFFPSESERAAFRKIFGDERANYAEALKKHYANPRTDFRDTHVSSYATAHPWEDWAETWAHYLHILSSWETAVAFGLRTSKGGRHGFGTDLSASLNEWCELMIALNSMNRSMGHDDAYPFQLASVVRKKLAYVAELVEKGCPKPPTKVPSPA